MNQWDTWLNSSDSPPPQPSEPINNTNRIAVPPPIVKPPDQTPLSLASPNSPFALVSQDSAPGVSALEGNDLERKPSIQLPDMTPMRTGVSSKRSHASVSGVGDPLMIATASPSMVTTMNQSMISTANPSITPHTNAVIPSHTNPLALTPHRTKRRRRGKEDDELYEESPGKKEETPVKRRRGRPVLESVVTQD